MVPIIYIGEKYILLTIGSRYSGLFPLPCQPQFSLFGRFFGSSSSSAFSILFSSPSQRLLFLLGRFFGSDSCSAFSIFFFLPCQLLLSLLGGFFGSDACSAFSSFFSSPCQPLFSLLGRFFSSDSCSAFSIFSSSPCQSLFSSLGCFFGSDSCSAFSIFFSSPCQPLFCLLGRFFGSDSCSAFSIFSLLWQPLHRYNLLCWCHTKRNHLRLILNLHASSQIPHPLGWSMRVIPCRHVCTHERLHKITIHFTTVGLAQARPNYRHIKLPVIVVTIYICSQQVCALSARSYKGPEAIEF